VSTAATAAYQDCIYGTIERMIAGWTNFDFDRYTPEGFTLRSRGREVGS
jgi:hypothetical protein